MNPSKIYFASDLHLDHAAMIQKRADGSRLRKPGYEERFLSSWDQIVKPSDTVFLLGDIVVYDITQKQKKIAYWFNRIKELPGNKILICGNHDHNRPNWYKKFGFSEVVPFGELSYLKIELSKNDLNNPPISYYGSILLSHVPAFEAVGTAYDSRFQGLMRKGERWYNRASCILNLHGHTHGKGAEDHRTFDVGLDVIGEQVVSLAQILNLKFPGIGLPEVVK